MTGTVQPPAAATPAEPERIPVPAEVQRLFLEAIRLQETGDPATAIQHYRHIILACPQLADAHNNLGVLLRAQGHLAAAASCFRRAAILAPDNDATCSNLGNLLWMRLEFEEAEAAFRQALRLNPARAETLHNYGLLRFSLGDHRGAIDAFDRSLAANPTNPVVHWDRALALLDSGDLVRGFAAYEVRFAAHRAIVAPMNLPLWQGEPLAGKTLYVSPEQGFGDILQFVRFLPLLAARGARVVLAVPPLLQRLLANAPGAAAVVPQGSPVPHADFQCPLLSLAHRLGTRLDTIPAPGGYLTPVAGVAGPPVLRPPGTRLAIGITWAGRAEHENDRNRSMSLEDLLPLADLPGVQLYSLQKGPRAADIAAVGATGLVLDLAPGIEDFADTAAALSRLDLVVSVDTALVHLAGAMGRPSFVLVPYTPDWRWMRQREDTPWYSNLRLVRQPKPRDWESVVRAVRDAVLRFLAKPPAMQA